MTGQIKLEVTCVHCLGIGEQKIYPIINKDNLEAQNSIFNEELFLYRCPHCGHYQRISYECIYYDEYTKYAVLLGRDGNKMLRKTGLELNNYQIRFVEDISELKEKIIINENGLDDRIIEIMKYNIRNSLVSKATYNLVINDKLEFVLLYPDNEIIKIYPFSKEDYLRIEKKYGNYLDSSYKVDKLFASKMILLLNKSGVVNVNYH